MLMNLDRYFGLCFVILLGTYGCQAGQKSRSELTQEIEQKVVLPEHSEKIEKYARYYFRDKNQIIRASYTIFSKGFKEFVREECLRLNKSEYPCNDPDYGVIDSGGYIWVDNIRMLPFASGGGCDQIEIIYNAATEKFDFVECNGDY